MKLPYIFTAVLLLAWGGQSMSQTSYYVNPPNGNNHWDGLAPVYMFAKHGPKASVQSAVNAASAMDTVNIVEPVYGESVTIGKSLTICCPGTPIFRNFALSNGCQLMINGTIEITGTLTLGDGVIATGPSCGIVVTNPAAGAVQITTGCIRGSITRTLELYSTSSYLFTDANTRITLGGSDSPLGTECTAIVCVSSAVGLQPPSFPAGQAINRYYEITSDPPVQGTLRMAYLETELNSILEANLSAFQRVHDSQNWVQSGGNVDPTNNWVELPDASLDSLSLWTLGDDTHPLPIQLASFNATVTGGNVVRLDWTTLTETNNYGFYVQQRVPPSEQYLDVENGFVPGHGTTIEPHQYSWMSAAVSPGTYSYRLKQVDLDGTVHFTDSREVIVSPLSGVPGSDAPAEFRMAQNYPNPFNPSTQIQFTVDRTGSATLRVFDVLGKEVATLFSGNAVPGITYTVRFDASRMANGTYFYKLTSGNQISLKKMLFLK